MKVVLVGGGVNDFIEDKVQIVLEGLHIELGVFREYELEMRLELEEFEQGLNTLLKTKIL